MKKIKDIKLFPKIFLLTFSIMALVSVLIHLIIYIIFPKVYVKNEEKNINNKSQEIANSLKNESIETAQKIIDIYSKNNDIKIYIKNNDYLLENSFKINESKPKSKTNILIIEEKTISLEDNKQITLQFIKSKDINLKARNLSLNYLPYTLLGSLLLSLVISYIYTKIILKPIEDINKTIKLMKKLDKKALLKITSKDEINEMKDTINSLYKTLIKLIEDLDKKNKEIIEIGKIKTEFLRSASHELKTPLASTKIILENMKYNIGKFKDRDKYLTVAIENIDKLNNMVKDIIYISSKNEFKDKKEEIILDDITDEILKMHYVAAQNKNIRIIKNLKIKKIHASRKKLFIILQNLISNAASYTKNNGKIEIGTKLNDLYIKNECESLNDKEIKKAFNLFEKINNKNESNSGTGVGLNIVKSILENENIKYKFKSYSKGMIFIIKLCI